MLQGKRRTRDGTGRRTSQRHGPNEVSIRALISPPIEVALKLRAAILAGPELHLVGYFLAWVRNEGVAELKTGAILPEQLPMAASTYWLQYDPVLL